MAQLKGTFTAMVTPFKEDYSLDMNGFMLNLGGQLGAGVHPVILGTTGEAPQVERSERREMLQEAHKFIIGAAQANKREPIMVVGITDENYKEMIRMGYEAAEMGATHLLATATPYNRPYQNDVKRIFAELNKIGLPIIVYNIQSRVGINIQTKTLKEMAGSLENVVAVKEASGNDNQIKEVARELPKVRPDFSVLSGDDGKTYMLLEAGGHGVISVVSNFRPDLIEKMVSSYLDYPQMVWDVGRREFNGMDYSKLINAGLQDLYVKAFTENNPKAIKGIMRAAGMPAGPTRPSLFDLEPESVALLNAVTADYKDLSLGDLVMKELEKREKVTA